MLEIVPFQSRSILVKNVDKPHSYTEIIQSRFDYIEDVIASFSEILIVFQNQLSDFMEIEKELRNFFLTTVQDSQYPLLQIPVCFNSTFGIDHNRMEEYTGFSMETIISEICESTFDVAFLGFLPGFAYMSGFPEKFKIPRLASPRNRVDKGSFAIAENQVGIYPNASPGGWNIIGNCPLSIFDVKSDELTLFKAGDQVKFHEISLDEHQQLMGQSLSREKFLR